MNILRRNPSTMCITVTSHQLNQSVYGIADVEGFRSKLPIS